jgi:2-methylcitrate dehydratase PrpD
MTVHIDPSALKVCCIPEPKTGLEIKFALQHLAGMALAGADTAALGTYSDANALDPRYIAIRKRVELDPTPSKARARHAAEVSMELKDGRKITQAMNVGVPAKDVSAQEAKLEAKFHSLAEPVIGRARARTALDMIKRFEELPSLKGLMEAVA